jgi:hypothetical protein
MSEYEGANKPNPHRDLLLSKFPQRPLLIPALGYPIDTAVQQEQALADTTGLNRHIAYMDSNGEPALITVSPDPERHKAYRGG